MRKSRLPEGPMEEQEEGYGDVENGPLRYGQLYGRVQKRTRPQTCPQLRKLASSPQPHSPDYDTNIFLLFIDKSIQIKIMTRITNVADPDITKKGKKVVLMLGSP